MMFIRMINIQNLYTTLQNSEYDFHYQDNFIRNYQFTLCNKNIIHCIKVQAEVFINIIYNCIFIVLIIEKFVEKNYTFEKRIQNYYISNMLKYGNLLSKKMNLEKTWYHPQGPDNQFHHQIFL